MDELLGVYRLGEERYKAFCTVAAIILGFGWHASDVSPETPEIAAALARWVGRKKSAFRHSSMAWEIVCQYVPLIDTTDDLELLFPSEYAGALWDLETICSNRPYWITGGQMEEWVSTRDAVQRVLQQFKSSPGATSGTGFASGGANLVRAANHFVTRCAEILADVLMGSTGCNVRLLWGTRAKTAAMHCDTSWHQWPEKASKEGQ